MTTQYAEEQGFKKKYLAPLIVLMLCAVSLTGAAYAYSTSISGNGDVDGYYYSIDLYKDASASTVIEASLEPEVDFEVMTDKVVNHNYSAHVEKTVVTYTAYVKVQSNLPSDATDAQKKCTIKVSEAKYNNTNTNPDFYASWATDATVEVLIADQTAQGDYAGEVNQTYKVTIKVTLPAISDDDIDTKLPTEVKDKLAFNGANAITVKLTATNAASSASAGGDENPGE